MANILKILHPFIPFFTETVWANNGYKKSFNNHLILSDWPKYDKSTKFSKNQNNINELFIMYNSMLNMDTNDGNKAPVIKNYTWSM